MRNALEWNTKFRKNKYKSESVLQKLSLFIVRVAFFLVEINFTTAASIRKSTLTTLAWCTSNLFAFLSLPINPGSGRGEWVEDSHIVHRNRIHSSSADFHPEKCKRKNNSIDQRDFKPCCRLPTALISPTRCTKTNRSFFAEISSVR